MLETKEVFQHTLRCGANRIILIHNHPSGNPAPSVEDELITQKIKEMADCTYRNSCARCHWSTSRQRR